MQDETKNTFKTNKKTYDWLKQYHFQKGNPGGPGRPKGKSLKTFVREMLESMDDEAKALYLKELDPEMIWQMGEGRPDAKTDVTSMGLPILQISKEIADKHVSHTSAIDNSQGPSQVQSS